MITRGSPESASAPASPSSRAPAAPSDSEPPADTAVVVDVTGGEEPWTATSARRTSDPPPLRSSKRASARSAPDMAPTKARKSKKKATKRPTASAAASGAKPLTREAARDSDSDLEVKAAPPPAKKTRKTTAPSAPAPAEVKRPAGPRSDQGFDLTTVMASFQPGRGGAGDGPSRGERDAPTAGPGPDLALELQFLRDEVARLRGIVGAQGPHGDSTRLGITTDPNTRGELPPAELCQLTSASFPEGGKKAKGDYNPPQAHLLAASRMFRSFGTETGKPLSAMSFVLWLRELECVKFLVTLAVLMAIFSGRLGSRGLTVMHFKESSEMETLEDGSTNANYSSDLSATAALPTASIRCTNYEDILDAIHGLSALGQEVWYDHMRKLW